MSKKMQYKAGKEHYEQAPRQVAESSTPRCQFQHEGDPGLQEGDSDMDWVAEFQEPEEINGNLRPSGSGEWYCMVEDRDGVIRPGGTGEWHHMLEEFDGVIDGVPRRMLPTTLEKALRILTYWIAVDIRTRVRNLTTGVVYYSRRVSHDR